jgi:hypothetical protein
MDDHGTSMPQIIEYAITVNGVPSVFTVEFRCRLGEHDQSLPTAVVLCQREGSQYSTDSTWAPLSSTFIADGIISSSKPLPSVSQPGIIRADVIEVAPNQTVAGRTAPPWVRVRLSKA